jgi:hypothetical protein
MRRIILTSSVTAVSCLLLLSSAANAEVKCPEGKTAAGDCVNPALAAAMRQTAIIFSQPKISQTAFPILPAADLIYRYPHQLIPSPLRPAPAWPGFE